MKLLRNLLAVVIALATLAVGVMFALQNKAPVPLDLLVYQLEGQSLALWLLLAFALGGTLGLVASSVIILRLRTALRLASRRLGKASSELDKLRTVGIKDSE
ncbi:MAG: DUF1049 domain-containing protein [Halieaceae bacterium]|jgi:lipopolysaccharide assembly protein A|nr:DUF1049 domain-containing protein [Halieaceae bacterium]